MILILDDYSEHAARAWRKIGHFEEKQSDLGLFSI